MTSPPPSNGLEARPLASATTLPSDLLARFGPLVIATRLGTVVIGLALAAALDESNRRAGTQRTLPYVVYGVPLVLYAALRTIRPLRYLTGRVTSLLMVLVEVGLSLGVVVATGFWDSPYVFCVAAAIVAAGFARGFGFAIRTAFTAAAAVAISYHLTTEAASLQDTVQGGGVLLLIGVVAGYARRIFGEAQEQSALARQANDLLTQLNAVAQTLPASLDLDETVAATIGQLRELFPIDVVAVLLREDATDRWSVVASAGARLPVLLDDDDMPEPVRTALADERPVLTENHGLAEAQAGLSGPVGCAIYLPLLARTNLIGLIALENRTPQTLGPRELQLGEAVAAQAALALDNARWFSRLRTVGADEERTRIARDLHDRVGQSLAFVSFELDRISRQVGGQPVEAELVQLRDEIRRVVTQVRDTLYDLRTDVSERRDLVSTLAEFVDRIGDRTSVDVRFDFVADRRLPVRKEREIWRVAQEAITNAARHADATVIEVSWTCDERGAVLEVRDDGRGMPADVATRSDTFGIVGMQERAAAIGGRLEFTASPEGGTTVRCEVPA